MVGIYDFTSSALIIIEPALVKMVLQTYFSSFVENAVHIDKESDSLLSYNPFGLSGEKWLNSRKRHDIDIGIFQHAMHAEDPI